jgi:hypothetical protein
MRKLSLLLAASFLTVTFVACSSTTTEETTEVTPVEEVVEEVEVVETVVDTMAVDTTAAQ